MTPSEKATGYFRNGFNCSQSVFAAFAPDLGVSEDDSLKIACAFGGGMGRQQFTCGAVTGALMTLGLKYGKALLDEDEKKQQTYLLTREFCNEFIKKFGTINCRELLMGFDMSNPEENQKIKDLNLSETHCAKYVEEAVKITENLLLYKDLY
jgi:C_GCAxxG_C_C family probable redox protein